MAQRLGARAAAMGDAYAALGGDALGAAYNPASLASLKKLDLAFLHFNAAVQTAYEDFACAKPFDFGTPGLSLAYRHMPDIDNPGALDAPISSNDLLASLSFARDLGFVFQGQGFLPDYVRGLAGGASLKYLRSHLGNSDASAFAADLGLKARVWEDWDAGLSVLNLGTPIRYLETYDPLPAEVLAGLSRQFPFGKYHFVTLALDLEQPLGELDALQKGELRSHFGMEDFIAGVLALRVGWFNGASQGLGGLTAGAGLRLEQAPLSFTFDYALRPAYYAGFSSFDVLNLISVGIGF
jgi:hypothetical protein